MKRFLTSKFVKAVAVVVIVELAGTWAVGAVRDKQDVATITEKMKTVCVGRFLIDLPEQTEYSLQGAFLEGFDIQVFAETDGAFDSRVAEREGQLRNPKPDFYGKTKKLEEAKDLKVSDFVGKMFVFGRKTTHGFEGDKRFELTSVQVEAYAHANGFSVNFSKKFADPERLDILSKLLAQLILNPENKIPMEAGFCIDHAYFRDPLTAHQGERVTMLAGLPARPDLTILFNTLTGAPRPKDGLLARTKKADEDASSTEKSKTKKLGDGAREINSIPGEQSLEGYHEFNGTTGYAFMWQSIATENDVFRPALSIELQSGLNPRSGGEPVQSSLSEKAMVDLWYRMSSSIRVRPTEASKVGAAEPVTPIGAYAWAGDTCLQSGWWQCSAGGDGVGVLGGQRQYLKQGERMPQSLLLAQLVQLTGVLTAAQVRR